MIVLLDSDVLIAVSVKGHVHHAAASRWIRDVQTFATCPITQGAVVRFLLRDGRSAKQAQDLVRQLSSDRRHEFWQDDVSYADVDLAAVIGHRQVTDAYLAGLARSRNGLLATFDVGLLGAHTDVAVEVPR